MFKLSVAVFCVNATQTAVEFYCWHVKKKARNLLSYYHKVQETTTHFTLLTLLKSLSKTLLSSTSLLILSSSGNMYWARHRKPFILQRLPHKGEFNEHLFAPGDNLVASWRQQSTIALSMFFPVLTLLTHTHTLWIALSHLWWILNLQLNPLMRLPAFPESIVITLNCF